jgi:hypothetical protein
LGFGFWKMWGARVEWQESLKGTLCTQPLDSTGGRASSGNASA